MAKDLSEQVDGFARRLSDALGEDLVSLVLFGSAVRPGYVGDPEDANTLLIVRDASPPSLRRLGPAVAHWVSAGHTPPLVFEEAGWRQSTDVFPIEIEEMREAHRLVQGRDPFADVTTTPGDLRHELEREVRGKLLQLRTEYVAAESNGKRLGELLIASAKTFFVLFRAMLRLKDQTPPPDPTALVRQTAEIAGIDAGAFDWVLKRLSQEKTPALQPFDPVGERYLEAIQQLAHFVDQS